MKIIVILSFSISLFFGMGCGGNSGSENDHSDRPWIGTWQMVGYDEVSVEDRDTIVSMEIGENEKIKYTTYTRNGEILLESEGKYKLNDQHSVFTVVEDGQSKAEYFIRKVDKDSFIFQSDTFSIKWKRID